MQKQIPGIRGMQGQYHFPCHRTFLCEKDLGESTVAGTSCCHTSCPRRRGRGAAGRCGSQVAQSGPHCFISPHSTPLHPIDVTCCSIHAGSCCVAFLLVALLFFSWSCTNFCFILENGQQAYEEVFFTANVTTDGSTVSLRNLLWMYSTKCSGRGLFQEYVVCVIRTLVKKMGLMYLYSFLKQNDLSILDTCSVRPASCSAMVCAHESILVYFSSCIWVKNLSTNLLICHVTEVPLLQPYHRKATQKSKSCRSRLFVWKQNSNMYSA